VLTVTGGRQTKRDDRVCSTDGCARPAVATGMCRACYHRDWLARRPLCAAPGCTRRRNGRQYCRSHERLASKGRPLRPIRHKCTHAR